METFLRLDHWHRSCSCLGRTVSEDLFINKRASVKNVADSVLCRELWPLITYIYSPLTLNINQRLDCRGIKFSFVQTALHDGRIKVFLPLATVKLCPLFARPTSEGLLTFVLTI